MRTILLVLFAAAGTLNAQQPRALFGDQEPFSTFKEHLLRTYLQFIDFEKDFCRPLRYGGVWILEKNDSLRHPYTKYSAFGDSVSRIYKSRVNAFLRGRPPRFRGSFFMKAPMKYDPDRELAGVVDTLPLLFPTEWPIGTIDLAAIDWLTLGELKRGRGGAGGLNHRFGSVFVQVGAQFPLNPSVARQYDITQKDTVIITSWYRFNISDWGASVACTPTKFDEFEIDSVRVSVGGQVLWRIPGSATTRRRTPTKRTPAL